MSTIRAFLALNLPVPLIEAVRVLQRRLRDATQGLGMQVAWVPASNMHVTVRFLGDIDEENAPAIMDRLHDALAGIMPLQLDIQGVGVFPDAARPRVLWVGVQSPGEALAALAKQVNEALEQLGFAPESRPFHGHLTLGRVKHGGSVQTLLDECQGTDFGQCTSHEVVLYKSVLQRVGAEYFVLGRVPLRTRP